MRDVLADGRLDAGSERRQAQRTLDLRRDRPGAVTLRKGDILQRRAAQAASGRQQRDRLDQIGLAGAVRPDQQHRPGADLDLRGVIAAEIGQGQATDSSGGHGRWFDAGYAGWWNPWVGGNLPGFLV